LLPIPPPPLASLADLLLPVRFVTRHLIGTGIAYGSVASFAGEATLSRKPYTSIHFAVKSCLMRCKMTDSQLICLSDFAEELELAGWDRESIETVERDVLVGLYGTSVPRDPPQGAESA
jgi:hypothetical protein